MNKDLDGGDQNEVGHEECYGCRGDVGCVHGSVPRSWRKGDRVKTNGRPEGRRVVFTPSMLALLEPPSQRWRKLLRRLRSP